MSGAEGIGAWAVGMDGWRAFADHMPHLLWSCLPDGTCDYVNRPYLEYTGQDAAAAAGTGWERVLHPDDVAATRTAWQEAAREGREFAMEYRFRRATDGAYRWFLGRGWPVRDGTGAVVRWFGSCTDIHERRRAELQLAEVRERLDLVVDAADLGLWRCDLPFADLEWNRQVKEHFWLPADAPVDIATFFDRIHPDDRVPTQAAIDRSIAERGRYDTEYRTVDPLSGRSKWIRAIGRAAYDAAGTPRHFDGVTFDVSERRAREERSRFLDEAARRLAATIEPEATLDELANTAVPWLADWIAIDLLDDDGALQRRIIAHRDPGKHEALRRMHDEYPARAGERQRRVLETGLAHWVLGVDRRTIESLAQDARHLELLRSLDLNSYAVLPLTAGGRAIGVLSICTQGSRRLTDDEIAAATDLASRAAAALANGRLYRRAQDLRRQAETLNEVCLAVAGELDLQRLVQRITDAGLSLTGGEFGAFFYNVVDERDGNSYTLHAISGVPAERFAAFPMPRATALFGPTFRGEGVIRLDDVRRDPRFGRNAPHHGMPAGHLPVVSYLAVPVTSRSGEVIGGLFYGHGEPGRFTEEHERAIVGVAAQAAVAVDNARLYASLASKAEQLARANAELQQFAYVSSHDLQEPLRTVLQYLDLLRRRCEPALDERGKAYIAAAGESAHRMYDLINDLLRFTQLDKSDGQAAPTALGALVEDALRDLQAGIAATGAVVEVGELPTVPVDPVRLRLVLQNLLGNALKFRGERPVRIAVSAERAADGWIVSVADNGIGIAPAHRGKVFEVFQRLHGRDRYAGTGIGLAICKKVVEQHRGRLWIEETPGGGATFRFTLPG